jgi:hypothetical protein
VGKAIKVYVVDDSGNTLSGQRVKEYGGNQVKTDGSGCAALFLEGTNTTIYVNGFEAYDGPVSRLDAREVFTTSGGRP